MATTGIVDGSIIIFKNAGATVAHATNFEMSDSVSTRNITTKDTAGGTEYAAQRSDTTISIEGMVAYDAAEGYIDLRADLMARTGITCTWGTFVTGDEEYSATVILTSVTKSAGLDENATWSAEGVITGLVTVSQTA